MHRMDEITLLDAIDKLETAWPISNSDARCQHFKEIIINVLHEHAKAFEDEILEMRTQAAKFDAIGACLIEMLNVDNTAKLPKAVAALQVEIAELDA